MLCPPRFRPLSTNSRGGAFDARRLLLMLVLLLLVLLLAHLPHHPQVKGRNAQSFLVGLLDAHAHTRTLEEGGVSREVAACVGCVWFVVCGFE